MDHHKAHEEHEGIHLECGYRVDLLINFNTQRLKEEGQRYVL